MNYSQDIVTIEIMDKNVVSQIRNTYDLTKDEEVLKLYRRILTGEINLSGPEGRELDDEIYSRVMEIKRNKATKAVADAPKAIEKENAKRERAKKKEKSSKRVSNAKASNSKASNKKVVVLTKGQNRAKNLMTFILFVGALACLVYFGKYAYDAAQSQRISDKASHMKENKDLYSIFSKNKYKYTLTNEDKKQLVVLDEYLSLYSQNKNLIGWLKIDDTNIDYPVMQNADNVYYLDHDMNQEPDKNGTLFMDCGCDATKPSTNLIIYGHNMRSGNMFGNLDKYKSESFYKKHKTIYFDTIYEKGEYEVLYVFNSHIFSESEIAFKYYQFIEADSKKEFDSNMKSMEEMSMYRTEAEANYGDQLLTLSTCDYEETDGRFVVVAKRIK